MTRVPHWEVVLAEEIEQARPIEFSWGKNDCASWSFGVVSRLRGEEFPQWLSGYRTKTGAYRKLKEAGKEISDLGFEFLGEPLETPLLAQRGDLVFNRDTYGISLGSETAHIGDDGGNKGLVFLPLREAVRAWRT